MFTRINITGKVYWIGVNDRKKHLFENIWPLPDGVAYNSYIIVDEKTAIVDTIESFGAGTSYLHRIEQHLEGRPLNYLIINHMELDHSGEVKTIIEKYPDVKIIGNSTTFKILAAYFGITENLLNTSEIGDTLDLGYHKLKFVMTPWIHWPETMMTYDTTDNILFSADAFGSFGTLDGGIFDDEINFEAYYEDNMRRYFSNIVGKYCNMTQKALKKLDGVPVNYICSTHGPVWRKNPEKVIELYDKWSCYEAESGVAIMYASMYGNTEAMADYIARRIAEEGIKEIRIFDVSKTHISYLISEIWKYKAVILGSCAYNGEMYPLMEQFCREMEHMSVKNKLLGLFGSYSWSGGGVKNLLKFAENIGWEQVADAIEVYGIPTDEKYTQCDALAKAMAGKLK
ncbi:MAG: FprA family A-type flavoprotein [Prevotellaceae bacterium]|jgi:flavorubredoxin|nr:FprA family A-type flavoprotein [Prevotellaceae bacterium]